MKTSLFISAVVALLLGAVLNELGFFDSSRLARGFRNLGLLTSDMFPRQAVGSVVGIGGMAGAVGGMFIAMLVGAVLQATGSYVPIFILAGSTYLVALLLIQLLVPKLNPAAV